jgi:hypothetical protein
MLSLSSVSQRHVYLELFNSMPQLLRNDLSKHRSGQVPRKPALNFSCEEAIYPSRGVPDPFVTKPTLLVVSLDWEIVAIGMLVARINRSVYVLSTGRIQLRHDTCPHLVLSDTLAPLGSWERLDLSDIYVLRSLAVRSFIMWMRFVANI